MIDYNIIDCHFHPAFDSETDINWFASTGSIEHQINILRKAGISQACGAPVKNMNPISFKEISKLNEFSLALRDSHPDFYIPAIQIHPRFPDESCREIERYCGSHEVRWIGELVGYMMGYGAEYATNDALTIFRTALKYNAVVNFHCNELDIIEKLSKAIPDLKLVLAHPGAGKDDFLARIALVAKYPNLHLDISGSGIDRLGMVRKAIDVAGMNKIIFGTDYPVNNPAVYTHGTLLEDLTHEERTAVFSTNFLHLIQR
ncbi:MAG: amidohydrolase [Fibrobacteres bacterium]|nr:amidohydrolase [Fibrobacterota bacterium]